MEHCQCDWHGVQSDADNTEESITSSTTVRRIAKTCLYTNTNATLNTHTNTLPALKQDLPFHILPSCKNCFIYKYKCNCEYKYKSITSSTTGQRALAFAKTVSEDKNKYTCYCRYKSITIATFHICKNICQTSSSEGY